MNGPKNKPGSGGAGAKGGGNICPIPSEAAKFSSGIDKSKANPALYFSKYFAGWPNPISAPNPQEKEQFLSSVKEAKGFADAGAVNARLDAALDDAEAAGDRVLRIDAAASSRIVSRLGEHHPLETGFFFHPLYGIPYLPGSGIKGAVRAAHEKEFPSENAMRDELFGPECGDGEKKERARGRARFLDAFPAPGFEIEADILNPHYPDYYRKAVDAAGDWESPIPVKFLTVAKSRWVFRVILSKVRKDSKFDSSAAMESLEAALRAALSVWGLGAKKSAGYGLFKWNQAAPAANAKPAAKEQDGIILSPAAAKFKGRLDSLKAKFDHGLAKQLLAEAFKAGPDAGKELGDELEKLYAAPNLKDSLKDFRKKRKGLEEQVK